MEETSGSSDRKKNSRREVINFSVMLVMFIIYALIFTVPKFYDMINIVYPYAGLVNFLMLIIFFMNNVVFDGTGKKITALFDIKDKGNREIYLLVFIIFIAGINLFKRNFHSRYLTNTLYCCHLRIREVIHNHYVVASLNQFYGYVRTDISGSTC